MRYSSLQPVIGNMLNVAVILRDANIGFCLEGKKMMMRGSNTRTSSGPPCAEDDF